MKRITQRLVSSVLLSALVVVSGCGSGRLVLPFQLDPATLVPPRDARTLSSHGAAVRGLSAILVKDLGLPMPSSFTVYVYSGRDFFEQGLVQDAQVTPVRAAELSEFAVGIGKRRQLLLNDDAGQPLARRVFAPQTYLRREPGTFAAASEHEFELPFEATSLEPRRYVLRLFYP